MTPVPSVIGIHAAALLTPKEVAHVPDAPAVRVVLDLEALTEAPSGSGACTPLPDVQSDHAQIAARIRAAMAEHDRVCGCRPLARTAEATT